MRAVIAACCAAIAISAVLVAPARAANEFDSAYLFESIYLTNLTQGDTGTFAVFFTNTGTQTWVLGTETQVNLAACRDDKVTCNVSPEEFAWNPGTWVSATQYSAQAKTTVPPNEFTSFTYDVKVPVNALQTTYHFNGDLIVAATSKLIHPEGYYQDARVVGAAPTAPTDLQVSIGDTNGSGGVNDVRVFFTAPATNAQNGYDVLRADGSCAILVDNPAFALQKTLTLNGGQSGVYIDLDRPNGTYCYEVRIADPTRNRFVYSNQAAANVNNSTVGVLPSTSSAVLTAYGQASDRLFTGARMDFVFSVPIRAVQGATIRFADADCGAPASQAGPEATCSSGTTQSTATVTCGGNALCFTSLDGKTLSVQLSAPPTELVPGTVTGMQYPLTVVQSSGITDAGGSGWNLLASSDRVVGPLGQ